MCMCVCVCVCVRVQKCGRVQKCRRVLSYGCRPLVNMNVCMHSSLLICSRFFMSSLQHD